MDDTTFRIDSLQDARTFEAFLTRYYALSLNFSKQ